LGSLAGVMMLVFHQVSSKCFFLKKIRDGTTAGIYDEEKELIEAPPQLGRLISLCCFQFLYTTFKHIFMILYAYISICIYLYKPANP
jgi:hypothetical protein